MSSTVLGMDRYKALFFDADDTLFDYPAAERAALTSVLRRFRIPLAVEVVIPVYRRHNLVLWREFEQGLTTQDSLREERFRRLFAEFEIIRVPIPAISDFYLEALSGNSQLLAGALELASSLAARFPLVLVTNGIGRVQRKRFSRSPITRFFGDHHLRGSGLRQTRPAHPRTGPRRIEHRGVRSPAHRRQRLQRHGLRAQCRHGFLLVQSGKPALPRRLCAPFRRPGAVRDRDADDAVTLTMKRETSR